MLVMKMELLRCRYEWERNTICSCNVSINSSNSSNISNSSHRGSARTKMGRIREKIITDNSKWGTMYHQKHTEGDAYSYPSLGITITFVFDVNEGYRLGRRRIMVQSNNW